MPQDRKTTTYSPARPDGRALPEDSGDFSIESTTMRLKSMKLRRQEQEKQQASPSASPRRDSLDLPRGERPSGRVRHDERGMAVWDWAVASGEFQTLSATCALKKLEVADLQIAETAKTPKLSLEAAGRDTGGGFDPYNQRGSGKREGEASQRQGVTGSKERVLEQLGGKKK